MLNHFEHELIATYEELHRFSESQRIMEYFEDLRVYVVKTNISDERVMKRLKSALDEIQLSREKFNSIADDERFIFRVNIIDYFKKHSKRNLQ